MRLIYLTRNEFDVWRTHLTFEWRLGRATRLWSSYACTEIIGVVYDTTDVARACACSKPEPQHMHGTC